MEIDDTQFKDKVEAIVGDYLKSSAFTDRKLTDTPTDALQVANKAYVDANFVTDATMTFSDITTNNASVSKHGFLPKLSGSSADYLDGNGNWNLPQYITGVAGEDFLAGDATFVATTTGDYTVLDTLATGSNTFFGNNNNSTVRLAQTFHFPGSTQLVSKFIIRLKKVGTPVDNVVITLRDNLDGNILQTIGTVAGGTITGAYADYTFTMTEVVLAKYVASDYVVQVARSGGTDAVNHYAWQTSTGSSYPNGFGATFDGTTWATNAADRQMIFLMTLAAGNFYKNRADITGYYEIFNGFVKTAVSKNAIVTVNVGSQHTMSGLTGHIQYLTDSPGLISATPGTYKKPIGFAVSATSIEFNGLIIRNYASGVGSLNSSTTLNVAHTLAVRPRFIRITAAFAANSIYSVGTYAGNHYSNGNGIVSTIVSYNSGSLTVTTDATNIIYINPSAGNSLLATLTGIDETNFTLTSTLSGTCTATFMWEAYS